MSSETSYVDSTHLPHSKRKANDDDKENVSPPKKIKSCKCGAHDHFRTSSSKCTLNKTKHKQRKPLNTVQNNMSNQKDLISETHTYMQSKPQDQQPLTTEDNSQEPYQNLTFPNNVRLPFQNLQYNCNYPYFPYYNHQHWPNYLPYPNYNQSTNFPQHMNSFSSDMNNRNQSSISIQGVRNHETQQIHQNDTSTSILNSFSNTNNIINHSNLLINQHRIQDDTYIDENNRNAVNNKNNQCKCGSTTHFRISHRDCPLNPNEIIENLFFMAARNDLSVNRLISTNVISDTNSPNYLRYILPKRDLYCSNCNALMWINEKSAGTILKPLFGLCCMKGKVKLPPDKPLPRLIDELITGQHILSKHFCNKIRLYNNVFAFASFRGNFDQSLLSANLGVYTFRLNGSIYHQYSDLGVDPNNKPKFCQIYFYDPQDQINIRMNISNHLERDLIMNIQSVLFEINPYIHQFNYALRTLKENPSLELNIVIKDHNTKDDRRYNKPASSEFAVIFDGNELSNEECKKQVVLKTKITNEIKTIYDTHHAYDPLHYVLMFPHGDFGWAPKKFMLSKNDQIESGEFEDQLDEFLNQDTSRKGRTHVTPMEFYSYKLQQRPDSKLHLFGRLFHQYIVDMYVKIENSRINFIKTHQDNLRSELYQGLKDLVNNYDHDLDNIGKSVILPSSFQGSPRHMQELFQDAMSIVRHFGKPDLFITFTCNPNWPDIQQELEPNQKANDRPEIVTRVFKLKLKELIKDIKEKEIFGKVDAFMYVIEFQKRGLPHAHILIILSKNNKIRTAEDVDRVVKAEIPDPVKYPQAYQTVINSMIHGPCGDSNPNSPCMKNGKCSKRYPKPFAESTIFKSDGYPVYKRSKNSLKVKVNNVEVDNSMVVPYNLFLVTKYNAHINVEICSTIKAVKYLCKYVHKGHDRVEADIQVPNKNRDECAEFKDLRFVSASEACWRIFHFSLHEHTPAVTRLAVHLEGQQNVVFNTGQELSAQLEKNERSTLTAWFEFNASHKEGEDLTYIQIVQICTWDRKLKQWRITKKRIKNVIGRMYFVSPTDVERYCLRLILNVKKAPKSFQDLKTVDGIIYNNYKSAAKAMGLIDDEKNLIECINEAYSIFGNCKNLREFVAQLYINGQVTDIINIWHHFKKELSEDVLYEYRIKFDFADFQFTEEIFNIALSRFYKTLKDFRASAELMKQLPEINEEYIHIINQQTIDQDQLLNQHVDIELLNQNISKLNTEQRYAFETITNDESESNVFFIDGPGGTGKTFLYNTILSFYRSKNEIALPVASSGIASLLLDGGQTAHSRFKIPIIINESSVSHISVHSDEAKLIRDSKIIIWDEAPMMNRYVYECIDRLFKDIMKSTKIFGGKKIVMGGDFRQILPVIVNGGKLEILSVSLKESPIWPFVKSCKLTQNMRVSNSPENEEYAKYLLKLGQGEVLYHKNELYDDLIQIDPKFCVKPDPNILIDAIFPQLNDKYIDKNYILDIAILAPTNNDVDMINKLITDRFPGQSETYRSIDSCIKESDNFNIPVEYLNSLNLSGLPPHQLNLKINQPIMLLRNICTQRSLCNGTRLIVKGLYKHTIKAEIAIGKDLGKTVLIPKMALNPTENSIPFNFKRVQFPIRPAFAFTINKSQGQTIRHVGIYLQENVFTHGQLYVAMSRVTDVNNIKIAVNEKRLTRNVVFKQIFKK